MEVAETNNAMDCAFGSLSGEVVLLGNPHSKTLFADSLCAVILTPEPHEDHFYLSSQNVAFDADGEAVTQTPPLKRALAVPQSAL